MLSTHSDTEALISGVSSTESPIGTEQVETAKLDRYLSVRKTLLAKIAKTPEAKFIPEDSYKRTRKLAFLFFLSLSLTQDSVGCFLGIQALLSIIKAITMPVTWAICSFFTLVNMALYYSFEAGMLKKLFGVNAIIENTKTVMETIEAQVEEAEKINQLLFNTKVVRSLTPDEYLAHAKIAIDMNNDLAKKREMLNYKESPQRKFLQWGISAFGALMTVAAALFETKALLAIVCAPLLGTPAGWAIIGIVMLSSLVLFCAMRGKGMASLMNPDLHKFNEVKDKLNKFEFKKKYDFAEEYNHKKTPSPQDERNAAAPSVPAKVVEMPAANTALRKLSLFPLSDGQAKVVVGSDFAFQLTPTVS